MKYLYQYFGKYLLKYWIKEQTDIKLNEALNNNCDGKY